MDANSLKLVDNSGNPVAELRVISEENGWFNGQLLGQQFPPNLKDALDWYDEVVEGQMLSFLDQAVAAVDRFELRILYPNGSFRKVYSLQVDKDNAVHFRTTPVPPPAWMTKSGSA